jgi:hypothetical protein
VFRPVPQEIGKISPLVKNGGEKVTTIRKPCGAAENFDRNRLVVSIRSAGASEEAAREVVERLRLPKEVSTDELTKSVAQELRQRSPVLSDAYIATENLKAKTVTDLSVGVAQLPEELVKRFDLASNQRVRVSHLGARSDMAVQPVSGISPQEVRLSRVDLYKLGAHDGAKVSVTFPHQVEWLTCQF